MTLAEATLSTYQLDIPAFPGVSAFSAAVSEAFLLKPARLTLGRQGAPGWSGYDPHNMFVQAGKNEKHRRG